jgi:hypothetical protein
VVNGANRPDIADGFLRVSLVYRLDPFGVVCLKLEKRADSETAGVLSADLSRSGHPVAPPAHPWPTLGSTPGIDPRDRATGVVPKASWPCRFPNNPIQYG